MGCFKEQLQLPNEETHRDMSLIILLQHVASHLKEMLIIWGSFQNIPVLQQKIHRHVQWGNAYCHQLVSIQIININH
jgi:hypothetical protein